MVETTSAITLMVIDALGILGVGMVVAAFYLISQHKITAQDLRYHLLNFVGAWLILFSLWFNWNTASVIIEIVWISVSGLGIWRCLRARQAIK